MSEPGPLLDRAAIQEAFRRLGDRLARNFLHRALPDRALTTSSHAAPAFSLDRATYSELTQSAVDDRPYSV